MHSESLKGIELIPVSNLTGEPFDRYEVVFPDDVIPQYLKDKADLSHEGIDVRSRFFECSDKDILTHLKVYPDGDVKMTLNALDENGTPAYSVDVALNDNEKADIKDTINETRKAVVQCCSRLGAEDIKLESEDDSTKVYELTDSSFARMDVDALILRSARPDLLQILNKKCDIEATTYMDFAAQMMDKIDSEYIGFEVNKSTNEITAYFSLHLESTNFEISKIPLKPLEQEFMRETIENYEHSKDSSKDEWDLRISPKYKPTITATNIEWDVGTDDVVSFAYSLNDEDFANTFGFSKDNTDGAQTIIDYFELNPHLMPELLGLPKEVEIPEEVWKEVIETASYNPVSDYLSDTSGYCVLNYAITNYSSKENGELYNDENGFPSVLSDMLDNLPMGIEIGENENGYTAKLYGYTPNLGDEWFQVFEIGEGTMQKFLDELNEYVGGFNKENETDWMMEKNGFADNPNRNLKELAEADAEWVQDKLKELSAVLNKEYSDISDDMVLNNIEIDDPNKEAGR